MGEASSRGRWGANVLRRMRRFFPRSGRKARTVQIRNRALETLAEGPERCGKAAGVAQSGHIPYAQELIRQAVDEHPKILLIGGRDGCSRAFTGYAVRFAGSMNFEIVALSWLGPGVQDDPSSEGGRRAPHRDRIRWGIWSRAVAGSGGPRGNRMPTCVGRGSPGGVHCEDVGANTSGGVRPQGGPKDSGWEGLKVAVPVHCLWAEAAP